MAERDRPRAYVDLYAELRTDASVFELRQAAWVNHFRHLMGYADAPELPLPVFAQIEASYEQLERPLPLTARVALHRMIAGYQRELRELLGPEIVRIIDRARYRELAHAG